MEMRDEPLMYQWADDDFGKIYDAIDALLASRAK